MTPEQEKRQKAIEGAAQWIEGYLLGGEGINIPLEFLRENFRTVARVLYDQFTAHPVSGTGMIIETMTSKEREAKLGQWHPHFAWFPVRWDGGWAWLSLVERRLRYSDWEGDLWEYRAL